MAGEASFGGLAASHGRARAEAGKSGAKTHGWVGTILARHVDGVAFCLVDDVDLVARAKEHLLGAVDMSNRAGKRMRQGGSGKGSRAETGTVGGGQREFGDSMIRSAAQGVRCRLQARALRRRGRDDGVERARSRFGHTAPPRVPFRSVRLAGQDPRQGSAEQHDSLGHA